ATCVPWPTIMAAMQVEYRVMWLARQAGDEGKKLAAAIEEETERLYAAQEQQSVRAASVPRPD
ncbi:MAG: hypothetical protein ACHQIO_21975, partial [Nevskiales bacterium]